MEILTQKGFFSILRSPGRKGREISIALPGKGGVNSSAERVNVSGQSKKHEVANSRLNKKKTAMSGASHSSKKEEFI